MKALLLEDHERLAYVDVPDPVVAPDEVLVAVRSCGICGSDVHGFRREHGAPAAAARDGARGRRGRRGGWRRRLRLGAQCPRHLRLDDQLRPRARFCREGLVNLCDAGGVLGVSCEDYRRDGAFAEYVAVPARILYRLPDELDFAPAATVETLAVALHGIERVGVRTGETAVVVGTGMVGLLVVQALLARGCARVIGVDVDRGASTWLRRSAPTSSSASRRRPWRDAVLALTGGRGADVAIEVVGASAPVATAIAAVRKGGRVSLIGNLSPEVSLPLQAVVTREADARRHRGIRGPSTSRRSGSWRPGKVDRPAADQRDRTALRGRGVVRPPPRPRAGLLKVVLTPDAGAGA